MNKDIKGHTAGFASSAGKAAVHGRHLPTVLLEAGCENEQIIMADGRIPRIVAAMSKV
ncbi:MAG: hypothetical protein IJM13_05820 [Lachnospiraceae bacterium]|nr:hypothetical protein [Lachnospiraceae bacterium]